MSLSLGSTVQHTDADPDGESRHARFRKERLDVPVKDFSMHNVSSPTGHAGMTGMGPPPLHGGVPTASTDRSTRPCGGGGACAAPPPRSPPVRPAWQQRTPHSPPPYALPSPTAGCRREARRRRSTGGAGPSSPWHQWLRRVVVARRAVPPVTPHRLATPGVRAPACGAKRRHSSSGSPPQNSPSRTRPPFPRSFSPPPPY